jgi:Uma2 family endonuclease
MAEPALKAWTVEEFFAWRELQPDRYELVGGQPLRMMAGANNVHDDIVVNPIASLREKLRGKPCRPFTGDGAVETFPGQIRRPDVGVDCGRRDPQHSLSADPRLVAEVLSPTTRDFDTFRKLEAYKSVAGLARVPIIEPNAPFAIFWSRDERRIWGDRWIEGLEAAVDMPELGVSLALNEIYDGVVFAAP